MDALRDRPRPRGKKPPSKQFLQKMGNTAYGVKVSNVEPTPPTTKVECSPSKPIIPNKIPISASVHQVNAIKSEINVTASDSVIAKSTSDKPKLPSLSEIMKTAPNIQNVLSQTKIMMEARKLESPSKVGDNKINLPNKNANKQDVPLDSQLVSAGTDTTVSKLTQQFGKIKKPSDMINNPQKINDAIPDKCTSSKPQDNQVSNVCPFVSSLKSVDKQKHDKNVTTDIISTKNGDTCVNVFKNKFENLANTVTTQPNVKPTSAKERVPLALDICPLSYNKPNDVLPPLTPTKPANRLQNKSPVTTPQNEIPLQPPKYPQTTQTSNNDYHYSSSSNLPNKNITQNSTTIDEKESLSNIKPNQVNSELEPITADDNDAITHKRNKMSKFIKYSERTLENKPKARLNRSRRDQKVVDDLDDMERTTSLSRKNATRRSSSRQSTTIEMLCTDVTIDDVIVDEDESSEAKYVGKDNSLKFQRSSPVINKFQKPQPK